MQKIGSTISRWIELVISVSMMLENDVSKCHPVKVRDTVVLEDKRRRPVKENTPSEGRD